MSTLAGVDLFQSLFDIVFGFGVSLIVLKFLKKGFETYVLWSDGDADEEPILALAGIFGSVMMTTKDQSNLSVVDQVQNLIRFLRGQKIYPYRYGDEWGLE